MDLTNFKKELTSINKDIYFDSNQYLREKSSNPVKLKQVIIKAESLLRQIKEETFISKDEKYFLYGTLGNLYRIYGKPKTAIKYLELNLQYSIEEKNYTREIISLIRLGEALKYDNQLEKALEKFNQALVKSNETEVNSHLDFALQHKGKCLLELKRLKEAIKCFQEALVLRRAKGSYPLINSTVKAIGFAQGIQD